VPSRTLAEEARLEVVTALKPLSLNNSRLVLSNVSFVQFENNERVLFDKFCII